MKSAFLLIIIEFTYIIVPKVICADLQNFIEYKVEMFKALKKGLN